MKQGLTYRINQQMQDTNFLMTLIALLLTSDCVNQETSSFSLLCTRIFESTYI